MNPNIEKIASAIGSAERLKIIALLNKEELNVGQIAAEIGLSHSATSQHLSKLRDAGLVTFDKENKAVFYRLVEYPIAEILADLVSTIMGEEHDE